MILLVDNLNMESAFWQADKWIPDDIWALQPTWKNFFENATTTQFNHRHMVGLIFLCFSNIFYSLSSI